MLQEMADVDAEQPGVNYHAALALLRGQTYDALENHARAIKWYKAALKADPMCYEAFQASVLLLAHAWKQHLSSWHRWSMGDPTTHGQQYATTATRRQKCHSRPSQRMRSRVTSMASIVSS